MLHRFPKHCMKARQCFVDLKIKINDAFCVNISYFSAQFATVTSNQYYIKWYQCEQQTHFLYTVCYGHYMLFLLLIL